MQTDPGNYIGQPLIESVEPFDLARPRIPTATHRPAPVHPLGRTDPRAAGRAHPRGLTEGSYVVNSSQGGGSKDTWVLGERPHDVVPRRRFVCTGSAATSSAARTSRGCCPVTSDFAIEFGGLDEALAQSEWNVPRTRAAGLGDPRGRVLARARPHGAVREGDAARLRQPAVGPEFGFARTRERAFDPRGAHEGGLREPERGLPRARRLCAGKPIDDPAVARKSAEIHRHLLTTLGAIETHPVRGTRAGPSSSSAKRSSARCAR